jgi:hypothetical protein
VIRKKIKLLILDMGGRVAGVLEEVIDISGIFSFYS